MGIVLGLILGKPLGVVLLCWMATALGICRLPPDLTWAHVFGAGILGGIGEWVSASKMAIVAASVAAGILGFSWLRFCTRPASG
jgi:Na+:H+ antiporter, NhaA family